MKQVVNLSNILDVVKQFPTDESCHLHFQEMRWGGSPVCVHCGKSRKIYQMKDKRILKCADCRRQFTARIGTIFEDSALPLQKWFMAIWLLMAHKKGVSSVQLGKDIGVTQKTAWFMLHRIRYAMRTKNFSNKPLKGTVEVDETFVGGKQREKGIEHRMDNKTIVFGMVERGGRVMAEVVTSANGRKLKGIIRKNVTTGSNLMSDEWRAYRGLGKEYDHETVNHSKYEYVRGDVHTNTIEGFWSLLKRGIIGIYHQVSRKHLDKYVDEFEYRYNTKEMKDSVRFSNGIKRLNGRLTYKELISNNQHERFQLSV